MKKYIYITYIEGSHIFSWNFLDGKTKLINISTDTMEITPCSEWHAKVTDSSYFCPPLFFLYFSSSPPFLLPSPSQVNCWKQYQYLSEECKDVSLAAKAISQRHFFNAFINLLNKQNESNVSFFPFKLSLHLYYLGIPWPFILALWIYDMPATHCLNCELTKFKNFQVSNLLQFYFPHMFCLVVHQPVFFKHMRGPQIYRWKPWFHKHLMENWVFYLNKKISL